MTKHISISPFIPPQQGDTEYWQLFVLQLNALSHEGAVDPNMQIEGINIFSRSGQDAIDLYCRTHHITPEQLENIPAYLRNKKE